MQSFVEWMDTHGFIVANVWDEEHQEMGGIGKLNLFPIQRRILGHCLTPDENGHLPYETIVYSTPKKAGKTTVNAAVVAWYMDQSPDATESYVIANSLEQGEGRVMKDLVFHLKRDKQSNKKIKQFRVDFENDSFIQTLAQNNTTAAGSRHALTSWDELWGSSGESDWRMWEEMTPINTVKNSLRFVSTYAGYSGESKILENLYKANIGDDDEYTGPGERIPGLEDLPCWRHGNVFIYWDHEPRFPWQTEQYYSSQAQTMRPNQYLRLHENRWTSAQEAFIPIEWWRYATQFRTLPIELTPTDPYVMAPMVIGVDAAPKRDCTAAVCVTYDSQLNKVILLTHKIWTPTPGIMFDMDATIEQYLIQMYNKYNLVSIRYDPAHLHQTMTRLASRGLPVQEYTQSPGNMVKASQSLYDVLNYQRMEAYPNEELESHIQNALAKQEDSGFRLVKDKRSRSIQKPMDASVALAIAVYEAISRLTINLERAITIESPFSDVSAWPDRDENEKKLPYMFVED